VGEGGEEGAAAECGKGGVHTALCAALLRSVTEAAVSPRKILKVSRAYDQRIFRAGAWKKQLELADDSY